MNPKSSYLRDYYPFDKSKITKKQQQRRLYNDSIKMRELHKKLKNMLLLL